MAGSDISAANDLELTETPLIKTTTSAKEAKVTIMIP